MPRPLPAILALAALAFSLAPARAQKATAVPRLNLDKLTGTWYQVAKLPVKAEKKCLSDGTVLYALNDKANTLQIGTFCTIKGGDQANSNTTARMDKARDGKLKIRRLLLLSRPYWVLGTDTATWALVGTPNHKSLWILSRNVPLPPETYAAIQSTAAAQGFPVDKLIPVSHPKNRITLASPSATPNVIETKSGDPSQTIESAPQ